MRRLLLPLLVLTVSATPVAAQQDLEALLRERAEAIPDGPRAFQETWLLPVAGLSIATDPADTRFAARVAVYQRAPRERLEIHRVGEDGRLVDPIVVVFDGTRYALVTPLGATPFLESDPARDPLVRMVLAGPPDRAPPHRTVPAEGGFAAIALRHAGPSKFDQDRAFATEAPRGGDALTKSLSRFSAAGDTEVVASAGARGADRIRTATGAISVTPDPAAVEWMESSELAVPPLELERFRREARLAPYHLLPAPPEPAAEDG